MEIMTARTVEDPNLKFKNYETQENPFEANFSPIRPQSADISENCSEFKDSNLNPKKIESSKEKRMKREKIRMLFKNKVSKKVLISKNKKKSTKIGIFRDQKIRLEPELQIPVFESKFKMVRPFNINRKNSTLELRNTLYRQKKKSFKKPDVLESSITERFIYLPGIGSIEFGDFPLRILEALKIRDRFFFRIEWKSRKDGTVPMPSLVSMEELKDIDPYFLLSFYESRIYSH